jgi:asparagine synthase (glutamine-hydrolysing)
MNKTLLKVANASQWYSLTEKGVTLFSVSAQPHSLAPIDCNTPSAFAWLLYDENKQEITAARDYLGLEPFYYCYQNQTLIFGSTIPDVIKQLPKRPELHVNRLLEECFHDGQILMAPYSNETHYQGIFRVEAGCRLHIKNNQLYQEKYWFFERGAATIYYANEQDYIEHFGELLNHALLSQIQSDHQLAAEYSGGLDSTAILAICHQNKIDLPLFCHVAETGQDGGDFSFAECVINHFNCKNVHYVDAKSMELNPLFQTLAQIYAGAPPYIYSIMSTNVYQSIKHYGCNRILSGFGGDQCVSSHTNGRPFFFELLQKRCYQQAWQEYFYIYPNHHPIQAFVNLLRYKNPALHAVLGKLSDVKNTIKSFIEKNPIERKPRFPQSYKSVREMQVDLLEGSLCHEVRARIEYSALLGKAMGFSHVYPLLHPNVIDFVLRLPCELKQRHGQSRYLIRKYLAQFVPEKNYTQKKRGGAHIMPAMMERCKAHVKTGQIDSFIQQLPFAKQIKPANSLHSQIRHSIFAYMINAYLNND